MVGFIKNPDFYERGEFLKNRGNSLRQRTDLTSGAWQDRGGRIFYGWVDTLMHNMICKSQKGMRSNVTRWTPDLKDSITSRQSLGNLLTPSPFQGTLTLKIYYLCYLLTILPTNLKNLLTMPSLVMSLRM